MQPTVPMLLTIKTKTRNEKGSGALKKPQHVVAALVDTQLQIDHQRGIHLVKPMTDPSKGFTYNTPHPKGSPTQMPAITQDYNDGDTLEPNHSYPDDEWVEEATEKETVEVFPRRSPRLIQYANFMATPPAGISPAALNTFMGNLYMQELQQSIAENAPLSK